jgi:hypothetical protein
MRIFLACKEDFMGNKSDGQVCGSKSLCGGIEVPSDDELVALNAMRSLREKAKTIREKMDQLERNGGVGDRSERVRMRQELDRLRMEWREWEKKKNRAARERMTLLGHEDPHTA